MDCDSGLNNSPLLTLWSVQGVECLWIRKTIILREWIPYTNMSYKSPFGSASHFANICQLKPWRPHFQPKEAKSFLCSSHRGGQSVYCNNSWETTTPGPNPLLLCMRQDLFSAAATKGWAWYKHNAELVEHTAALRDLKLLVGSGGLDFTKGMDSLDKHVKQISFRQCITFREHGQLKGWQPHFQPTDAKISILSISTIIVHWTFSCRVYARSHV